MCRHVLRKAEAANHYVSGHITSVEDLIARHIRMVAVSDRVNIATVKKTGVEIGRSQRALMEDNGRNPERKAIP